MTRRRASRTALLAEIEAHERELASLAQTDPEFYQHLQKHDKELLNFSGAKLEEEAEDEDEDEGGAGAEDEPEEGDKPEQEILDMAGLKALEKAVLGPSWSVRAVKKLLRAFRSAVHIGEVAGKQGGKKKGESDAQEEARAQKEAAFRHTIQIHSSQVYNELVRFTLNNAPRVFAGHHLAPVAAAAAGAKGKQAARKDSGLSLQGAEKHPKWGTMGPLVKALLAHVLFFLTTLRSNANPRMARFVLGALERFVPLMHPFPKLAAKFLRELLAFWSESEQLVRIDAFLRIRQMAIELSASSGKHGGESMLELCLKGAYLTYVRSAKFSSALTLPVVEFMANCVVELYGLDPVLSYQHAFVYIRQLAIHLRTAILAKKKDSHRAVYNWSFVNSLRVWTKVLAAHGKPTAASEGANGVAAAADNLNALVYPLVQVSLGTLGLLPSSRYFPLRFHVVRLLLDLCDSCSIYVPLAPYLLSVLSAPELSRKPVSSTRKALDIHSALKAPKHVLLTKTYQESAVGEALHLLLRYFSLYSTSIAYPELVLPAIKRLRRDAKEHVVIHRVRKQMAQTVLKLEANVQWVQNKRNGVPFAPKDMGESKKGVDGLRTFTPEGAAAHGGKVSQSQQSPLQRFVAIAIEERRLLDEAKADWDGSKGALAAEVAKSKKKKGGNSDDEEDDEADEEDEAAEHQRRRARDEDEDDEADEADFDDEDEDEDMGGDDDDEDDDEDARPLKKARGGNGKAAAAPSKPFEYPADLDEANATEGDKLEVFNFDDEDDVKPKKKGQAKGKAKQPQTQSVKKEQKPKQQAPSVKKEQGGKAGAKRKRAA